MKCNSYSDIMASNDALEFHEGEVSASDFEKQAANIDSSYMREYTFEGIDRMLGMF